MNPIEVKKWLQNPTLFKNEITTLFSQNIIPTAVERLNAQFSPNRLSKQSRTVEPLPIEQRQLSSYRTRLGTISSNPFFINASAWF